MVNSTILSGVVNKINSLITSVFENSTKMNLNFIDVSTLPSYADGFTDPNGGIIDVRLNVTVQLDLNHLPNYSQEYIARVIMHESLHAYLMASGTADRLQHEDMAIKYVTQMALALQQMFPGLSDVEAKNVSLGGLQFTDTFANTIKNDLSLTGSFDSTNLAYSVGPKGKRCNSN
ncbi:hypothetical protein A0256_09115 [Mucilaginibacter sp. PAMC 26640]|nr:hypothetical protein A0256_09115 [Mucilaginibacter sp. PAMC 26640]